MSNKVTAVIIDDMPLAIRSLEADIDSLNMDIEIIGTAEGVVAGAKLIREYQPQIVFLDIHMEDGDGFDLLEITDKEDISVIFTTASREHAIKAFRFEAVDYLLKPVDPELLKKSIEKAIRHLDDSGITAGQSNSKRRKYISVSTQEELRRIRITDIIRLEATGNYTRFYLMDAEKMLVSKTLKAFEKELTDDFIRVHQSHLVNKEHVRSYIKTEGGYILMKDESRVPVSVRKKAEVLAMLNK